MKLSSTAGTSHLSSSPSTPRRAPEARPQASPNARTETRGEAQTRLVAPSAPKNRPVGQVVPTSREAVIERKPRKERNGDENAPKKRVRLKPETPEQLLERLRNPQLSLHEASILLRVSRATVRRYADSGRLGCQRTPGGQRRFFLRDIENFYRQLKLKR